MRSFLVVIVLILLVVVAYFAFNPSTPAQLGDTTSYPFEFSLPSTEGEMVSKDDFAGRVLIVDFWGTWCPPCRRAVPHLVELQEEYRDEGLSVVGLTYEDASSFDEAIASIAEFTSEVPVNYPLLIGDPETQLQVPDFSGYPTMLFIDRQGRVRRTLVGLHTKQELEAIAQSLLNDTTTNHPAPTT